ncbi:hypothetical protein Hanom_Chr10g00944321 [Helianthus anomalus]
MNIFYSKAGGAMVVAALPEGRPPCLDQIRDNFLHPSNESLATYANTILDDDCEDDIDFDVNPTREEPILLSSEESNDASFHLICLSSRVGPQRGHSEEPDVEVVPTPVVDPHVGAAEQSEGRKKKREEKVEKKKRLRNLLMKRFRDPDDDGTLTELVKKRKILEDKKRELDAQAAAALS